MTDMPLVTVVLLTYERTEYALRTIDAMRRNWLYSNTAWYVSDDGSRVAHIDAVLSALAGLTVWGHRSIRGSYGNSANHGWFASHEHGDLTLFLEDDWDLRAPFDVTPYVQLLSTHDNIGMVRLAHLPSNLNTRSVGYDGRMYLQMLAGQQYAFSGNPALRHRRAREAWGAYPERLYPGDTELAYDLQVQQRGGPSIVWPLAVGEQGVFGHIGTVQSYKMPEATA